MNRLSLAGLALIALTLPSPSLAAQQAPAPPPAPAAAAAQPKAPMAYYLVQGSRILSKPYVHDEDCQKALVALRKGLAPGTDTVFCAHRRP